MKLLGVTFDEHLKFISPLDDLSKRVPSKIGVLVRLKNLIPTLLSKFRTYKSFILPQLNNCQTVWRFCKNLIGDRSKDSTRER